MDSFSIGHDTPRAATHELLTESRTFDVHQIAGKVEQHNTYEL